MTENIKISDLQLDDHNANKGGERGTYMIRRSLERLGAGRSILVDKNGKVIAGNKTLESAGDVGIDDVILVRTRGNQLVAVMREDLDLDDPAYKLPGDRQCLRNCGCGEEYGTMVEGVIRSEAAVLFNPTRTTDNLTGDFIVDYTVRRKQ